MCATCGCSDDDVAGVRIAVPGRTDVPAQHGHDHEHGHGHGGHGHGHAGTATVEHDVAAHPAERTGGPPTDVVALEVDVLARNDALAARLRDRLSADRIVALNLMSSPGSGKTTLLERTLRDLGGELPCAVLEGDQETLLDAERIAATGARVVQVNTGAGCHLDADMLDRGLRELDPAPGTLLFVENVGNLVCPALFDLGETARVVVISVTEGTDKPLKYPHMFRTADLVLVNKIDLLPYVDFDLDRCAEYVHRVAPGAGIRTLSATRGDGLEDWYGWLRTGPGSAEPPPRRTGEPARERP